MKDPLYIKCKQYIDCYDYLLNEAAKYSANEVLEAQDDLRCAIDELKNELKMTTDDIMRG
jgi:hypothetical protein